MKETGKAVLRRASDYRYASRYLIGNGIDVGSGDDPLSSYKHMYPNLASCIGWDVNMGDAQHMASCQDDSFDFVHSSHCLEHLHDPVVGLGNWIRICKPNGHLVLTFPDEDLYEQGLWPSTKNHDHKHTFTLYKDTSWSPRSINVFVLLSNFADKITIIKAELVDHAYDYSRSEHYDQTYHGNSECAIEVVLRKKSNV